MTVKFEKANIGHAAMMANKMRPEAAMEVEHIGPDKFGAIRAVLDRSSHAWSGFYNDEIVLMWGIQNTGMISGQAYLWLITTELAEKHQFLFVRWSRRFIDELRESGEYKLLTGQVRDSFAKSIWWLKWLGFKVDPPVKGVRFFHWEA